MKLIVVLIGALVVTAGFACSSAAEERAATMGPAGATTALIDTTTPSPPVPRGFDDLMVEIENAVPGFAGLSVDEASRSLKVRMTTSNVDRNSLQNAIVSRFPRFATFGIEIVGVSFDFSQLSQWYDDVQNVIFTNPATHNAISMTDIDEVRNQIIIGVPTEEARHRVLDEIATLNLPPGAVVVEIRPFPIPL